MNDDGFQKKKIMYSCYVDAEGRADAGTGRYFHSIGLVNCLSMLHRIENTSTIGTLTIRKQ